MKKITDIDSLQIYAREFLESLSTQDDGATIIKLSGDLGVGKTAFVKACARELGIEDDITSPTFVIQKEYLVEKKTFPFHRLVHIDAYRLESAKELEYLGWNDLIKDPMSIICIEWPEQVSGIQSPGAIDVHIQIDSDHKSRIFEIKK